MKTSIEIVKVKKIVKNIFPEIYDKIIISDTIKINNYKLLSYNYKTIERALYQIKAPVYKEIVILKEQLQKSNINYKNKAILKDDGLIDSSNFSCYSKQIESIKNNKCYDFPIDVEDDKVIQNQRMYFLADSIEIYDCYDCDGDGLVTCDVNTCGGEHIWECNTCIGEGKISCNSCSGEGWKTCSGWSGCSGSGKTSKDVTLASGKVVKKQVNCSKCSGKGKIVCTTCNKTGKVRCDNCSGKKKVTCNKCYGDKNKYGQIDCGNCEAQGDFLEFLYVKSHINEGNKRKIISSGDELVIEKSDLEKFYKTLNNPKEVFRQHNEIVIKDYNEEATMYCQGFNAELSLDKSSFPKLLNEAIAYKTITCIEFTYTHIISNEIHTGLIINYNESPEVKFLTNPEEVKKNVKSVMKSTSSFFSKILKTQKSKLKNDRLLEIKLMIYIAKSDGIIEESEKKFLLEAIQNLNEFTNAEKKSLFDLMSLKQLPELTVKDLKFSDSNKGLETINMLEELAMVDGEFEASEKDFIQHIKNLLN